MDVESRTVPRRLHVVPEVTTTVVFDTARFSMASEGDGVRVAVDDDNWSLFQCGNQVLPAEAAVLDTAVVLEERQGVIDHRGYFVINWHDSASLPSVIFMTRPREIVRSYRKGQRIELGLDDVGCYQLHYADGVEARFERSGPAAFDFEFSTGFRGAFWRDAEGWTNLRFRGCRMEAESGAERAQSKFVVSRCKYSDNLQLVLQDDAEVRLS